VYQEGILAGIIGAVAVTIWGLLVDSATGRLFHTASALGMALFDRGGAVDSLHTASVSIEMAVMFMWLRALAFMAIGGVAAHLVNRVDRNPGVGFGVMLLAVIFAFAFTAGSMILAAPILKALTWSVILMGNLVAAAAMAVYFWRRYPRMTMHP